MSEKRTSVTQAKPRPVRTVKVSVLMPAGMKRRLEITATADRRRLSPQIVTLLEEALATRESRVA
jgi:hypothetical protein